MKQKSHQTEGAPHPRKRIIGFSPTSAPLPSMMSSRRPDDTADSVLQAKRPFPSAPLICHSSSGSPFVLPSPLSMTSALSTAPAQPSTLFKTESGRSFAYRPLTPDQKKAVETRINSENFRLELLKGPAFYYTPVTCSPQPTDASPSCLSLHESNRPLSEDLLYAFDESDAHFACSDPLSPMAGTQRYYPIRGQ